MGPFNFFGILRLQVFVVFFICIFIFPQAEHLSKEMKMKMQKKTKGMALTPAGRLP